MQEPPPKYTKLQPLIRQNQAESYFQKPNPTIPKLFSSFASAHTCIIASLTQENEPHHLQSSHFYRYLGSFESRRPYRNVYVSRGHLLNRFVIEAVNLFQRHSHYKLYYQSMPSILQLPMVCKSSFKSLPLLSTFLC